jgi:glycosyltransferase involved in cell wall biosynthesis
MKIVIIHPFLFRLARGIERFVVSLSAKLAETGHEIHILTWTWPRPVSWTGLPGSVLITRMPYLRYFAAPIAAAFYVLVIALRRPDRVMVFFAGYGEAPTLAVLRIFRRQKYCVVFHFPVEEVPHRYREFARYGLVQRADHLIAVSQHVAAGVRRCFGRECVVIPNGVDVSLFHPGGPARQVIRSELGIGEHWPVLITLAALEERKGVQWLIGALPSLLSEFPDIRYLVLGEGAYRQVLQDQVDRLGLGDHVRLLGVRENAADFLASADIGCLLSRGEAMPLTLLEYMAMELPVVTSFHPPFDEFVRPAWGVSAPEVETQPLAQVLSALLRDRELRNRMGKAGRAEVIAHYSWANIAQRYLTVLDPP